jgi:hypothetical protein
MAKGNIDVLAGRNEKEEEDPNRSGEGKWQ